MNHLATEDRTAKLLPPLSQTFDLCQVFDDQEFGVLSEISFMSSKEVQAVVIHAQRRAMTAFASHLSAIEELASSNYKKWKRGIELARRLMDLDMCLLDSKPSASDGWV